MNFNEIWNLFAQAGLRPGDPGDEHRSAGIGVAEVERFRIIQEQNSMHSMHNTSPFNSGIDPFNNFGKHDF